MRGVRCKIGSCEIFVFEPSNEKWGCTDVAESRIPGVGSTFRVVKGLDKRNVTVFDATTTVRNCVEIVNCENASSLPGQIVEEWEFIFSADERVE